MNQEQKDRKEMDRDPLERLNKARTKRLEKAYFQKLKDEELFEEDREILDELGINHY